MSKETDLKKKIGAMLGTGVLATALTAAPVSFNVGDLSLDAGTAFAKGGGGEGGEGGNSGSGSDDSDDDSDNSGSGSSNSGSGSSNSGSGSGESGDSGESGESGDSGESGESGDSGESGESGDSGERGGSGRGKGRSGRGGGASSTDIPPEFGFVVKAEVSTGHVEIGYSDGWKEEIENGRYELKNPSNRTVVERPATQADINRLNAAARASRL
jgi:hypothetical protein